MGKLYFISVTEIYGIHSAGKYNSMQKVYHEFYRIYGEENGFDPENVKEIITEDSNSGYQFFRAVCRRDISCRSAAENSNALGAVEKSNRSEILVIADGAAFGQYMGQLDTYQRRHHNVHLFLPESFESVSKVCSEFCVSSTVRDGGHIEHAA